MEIFDLKHPIILQEIVIDNISKEYGMYNNVHVNKQINIDDAALQKKIIL